MNSFQKLPLFCYSVDLILLENSKRASARINQSKNFKEMLSRSHYFKKYKLLTVKTSVFKR